MLTIRPNCAAKLIFGSFCIQTLSVTAVGSSVCIATAAGFIFDQDRKFNAENNLFLSLLPISAEIFILCQ